MIDNQGGDLYVTSMKMIDKSILDNIIPNIMPKEKENDNERE